MSLESGKHLEKEINEVRCHVVETGISKERVDFLKALLEHNGYVVHYAELPKKEEDEPTTYILGVTDVTFNAVLAVYKLQLVTQDGRKVSPAYWRQQSESTALHSWAN
mgnify:CR=1 FL=1